LKTIKLDYNRRSHIHFEQRDRNWPEPFLARAWGIFINRPPYSRIAHHAAHPLMCNFPEIKKEAGIRSPPNGHLLRCAQAAWCLKKEKPFTPSLVDWLKLLMG